MAPGTHPPVPGPFVRPNLQPIMEAVSHAAVFPISKRELIESVGDETVIVDGRNVELHELVKDIYDDYFATEEELLDALERLYTPVSAEPDEIEEPAAAASDPLVERMTPAGEVLPPPEG